MKDKFAKIDEVFDSDSNIVKEASAIKKEIVDIKTNETDVRRDYEYTRGNLYSLIEKGQEAINGIMELAQESEMPRAYEVAGQLIKNVADATDKLLELQKKVHQKVPQMLLMHYLLDLQQNSPNYLRSKKNNG